MDILGESVSKTIGSSTSSSTDENGKYSNTNTNNNKPLIPPETIDAYKSTVATGIHYSYIELTNLYFYFLLLMHIYYIVCDVIPSI